MENINKYDLFIAYHGTENPDGSVDKARKIYNWLTGKGIKCFFHPETNKVTGNFGDTSEEAKCSKLFLLVANSYVPRKLNGTLDSEEINGEIKGYFSRYNTSDYEKSGRVYAYGGLDAQDAGALHTKLSSIAHFEENGGEVDAFHRALDWIRSCLKKDAADDGEQLRRKEEKTVAGSQGERTKTEFNYDSKRGMMINPDDGSRNISFRADTLEQFLGDLYASIAQYGSDEIASKVFYDAGYERGFGFAERANSLWVDSFDMESVKKNVDKWCEFDSQVGWGKFSAEISFGEDNEFKGSLTIIEPIMVDRKNGRKTCAFLRGYCTGVLNKLLDTGVTLKCKNYPNCVKKPKLGACNKCEFDIILDD